MTTDVRQTELHSLGSDIGTATTSLVAVFDVPLQAGVTYGFKFVVPYTAAATTTGSRWVLNGPAMSMLAAVIEQTLTATSKTINYVSAYNVPAAANASSLTAGNVAVIEGVITTTAAGSFQLLMASEVAASAVTAKAGAYLWLIPLK